MRKWLMRKYEGKDEYLVERTTNLLYITMFMVVATALLTIMGADYNGVNKTIYAITCGVMVLALLALITGHSKAAHRLFILGANITAVVMPVTNMTGYWQGDACLYIACVSVVLSIMGYIAIDKITLLITFLAGVGAYIFILWGPIDPELLKKTIPAMNKETPRLDMILLFVMVMTVGIAGIMRTRNNVMGLVSAKLAMRKQNQELEKTVEARTEALRTILDSTGQGFCTFGRDMRIEKEYSKECKILFNEDIAGKDIGELLFGQSAKKEDLHKGIAMIFDGIADPEVIFNMQDKECRIGTKMILLQYRMVSDTTILCAMTDITAQKKAEQEIEHDKKKQELVYKALNNKMAFASFINEAKALFPEVHSCIDGGPSVAAKEALVRAVHTFKANAGFLGFWATMEAAHEVEEALKGEGTGSLTIEISLASLQEKYEEELGEIVAVMGEAWIDELNSVVISRDEYDRLLAQLRAEGRNTETVAQELERLGRVELKELLARIPETAKKTAERLGKRIKPMVMKIDPIKVQKDAIGPLTESFVHIVNNMVDHGIEASGQRVKMGKAPEGLLSLEAGIKGKKIVFKFYDDGRGIDLNEIASIAIKKGFIKEGQPPAKGELLGLLFKDGFSTKQEASLVSGRGVGLAAVRESVERLGGSIEVDTIRGRGTSFTLQIPYILETA